jgi:hypothetical protein
VNRPSALRLRGWQFSERYREAAQRLLAIEDAGGATPELRAKLIDAASEAVRAQGAVIMRSMLAQADDQLRYEFFVDETAPRCAEINFAIAAALCEEFEDPAPEFVTFSCRPLSSYQFNGDMIG